MSCSINAGIKLRKSVFSKKFQFSNSLIGKNLVNVPILKSFLLEKCTTSYWKVCFGFTAGTVDAMENHV